MAPNALSWLYSSFKSIWPDPPTTAHILVPQISVLSDASLVPLQLGPTEWEIPMIGVNIESIRDRKSGTKFVSWCLNVAHPTASDLPIHALAFGKAKAIMPIINHLDHPNTLAEAKYYLPKCIWTEDIEVRRSVRELHWENKPPETGAGQYWSFFKQAEYDVLGEDLVLKHLPILLLVNYEKLSGATDAEEYISKELDLAEHLEGRDWRVQPCCFNTGEGLREGFNWLATLTPKPQQEMFQRMAKKFPEMRRPEMVQGKLSG